MSPSAGSGDAILLTGAPGASAAFSLNLLCAVKASGRRRREEASDSPVQWGRPLLRPRDCKAGCLAA
eukprot:scaffold5075_cov72-Phaeocystis_antarctica.AAC.4